VELVILLLLKSKQFSGKIYSRNTRVSCAIWQNKHSWTQISISIMKSLSKLMVSVIRLSHLCSFILRNSWVLTQQLCKENLVFSLVNYKENLVISLSSLLTYKVLNSMITCFLRGLSLHSSCRKNLRISLLKHSQCSIKDSLKMWDLSCL